MDVDRRSFLQVAAATAMGASLSACATTTPSSAKPAAAAGAIKPPPEPTAVWDLWPGALPGGKDVQIEEKIDTGNGKPGALRRLSKTAKPRLLMFKPEKPNGAALIICPGGGYSILSIDLEGAEPAARWAAQGVTTFVLYYRLPGDGWAGGPDTPLQDLQRAVRLVRSRATELGVDPLRIGVQGYSAGGHLAGSLATRFGAITYRPSDAIDNLSARPDFVSLLYPVITLDPQFTHAGSRARLFPDKEPTEDQLNTYSVERAVNPRINTPPVFIAHAADDRVVVDNSLLLFSALRTVQVPAEIHIFESGGHGFGLRAPADQPVHVWPELFEAWAKRHKFF